jgi:tripartite-type tricarboxylate transporter receptor subunit TctC
VPYTAGSTIDIIPRMVFEPLASQLGQPIIVENRGGAGGTIGAAAVARADPDGYTLLVNSSAHSATPAAYPKAPYDTVRDFAAVIPLGNLPNVTVISPAKGIKTLQELAAAAKARPGTLSYASVGVGTATFLSAERFRLSAGFQAVHVPFKGAPEALTEVMTGRVDFFCCGISSALPFIRDGKLLALAVSTPTRASALPDVPTMLDAGFVHADYTFWIGMFVPAKTPLTIIEKLHQDTLNVLQKPVMLEKLSQQGVDPMPMTPVEFDALVKDEIAINAALLKAAG